MAKKAGRPTKYSAQVLRKTRKYIEDCGDEFYDYLKSDGDKSSSWEQKVRVKLPTVEGLALHLGVHRDTIYAWREKHPQFSYTIDILLQKQREMLIAGGVAGYYNSTITKLVLATNHGMTERNDVTSGDKPIEGNSITFVGMKSDDGTDS